MKLTRTGSGLKSLLVLLCLGIQYGLLDAKAIKKSKHGVHKSGSKKNNAPKGNFCVNHSYCVKYSDLDCASEWVQLNCPRMCRLCEYEGPDILKLPAVVYYRKGNKKHGIAGKTKHHRSKHSSKAKVVEKRDEGDRRDVVFLKKPYDYTPTKKLPTTSYNVFDYEGNYRNWLFLFPDKHPVNMRYVDQGKAADPNQPSTEQQQAGATQDAAGAPLAAPTVASVAPAVAQPAVPAAAQPAAFAVAQPAAPNVAEPVASAAGTPAATAEAQSAAPAVASPVAPAAPAAAVAPVVPQTEQTAAAPAVAQQPAAVQPAVAAAQPLGGAQTTLANEAQVTTPSAANQTIELLNQTVTLATNETQQPSLGVGAVGFQPTVGNVTATNQTLMAGLYQPNAQGYGAVNNTSNQTVTAGNFTSQNQSQSLDEPQKFFIHQPNSSKASAQTQSEVQAYSQETRQQFLARVSQTHHVKGFTEEPLNTSPPRPSPLPSSLHMSAEEVKSEHRLHVDNMDASSEMQGNFNPNGASVTLSGPGTMDLTTTGQSFTQDATVDSDGAAQTPWTCCRKVDPPKDCKPCPKLPKAPPMPYVFNIYCNDIYKDCAYGYSNCNDTWWEINCPKTCGLCQAKDKIKTPTTKQVLPTEVKDLENTELESDLVAPVPGEKPLVAKYTLRVKPKLVNGVPQMQEIRIMPPNKASGFVKPLMILKQNITKPMIENIEIDVPKKGAKFSRKPSVEVIEGDHKEMLQVHRGQAIVENSAQKSEIKPEETKEAKPANKIEHSIVQAQSPSTTTTEQNKTTETTTEQTQSSSTITTTEQNSDNQTSTAQTPSTSTVGTAAQSTDSDRPDTRSQSYFTASSTQTADYSTPETCTDDSLCATYTKTQCGDSWLRANCKSKCKLC